ncbi:hypothetical protein [Mycobacterium sp. JS623]|uniref:hypothetical protein n=1 Tax=Mycobacterium sp. JS623 TaxID=212767 RepID=UPI0002ECA7B9|nr:hypothetical protein [Mycobacterium sp. JS623]
MMLIARNRSHPRDVTSLPYETWTSEFSGDGRDDHGRRRAEHQILISDAKTAAAAAAQLGCEVGYPVIWTAAGAVDSVMSMTYEQRLVLTDSKAMPVR